MMNLRNGPFYVAGPVDMELIDTLVDLVKDKHISDAEFREMVENGLETLQTSLLKSDLEQMMGNVETAKRLAKEVVERLKRAPKRTSDDQDHADPGAV